MLVRVGRLLAELFDSWQLHLKARTREPDCELQLGTQL